MLLSTAGLLCCCCDWRRTQHTRRRISLITVKGLSKKLPDGTLLLKDISFQVEKGEFVALFGESGVGKTVLLRCVNGLTAPDSGEVIINGDGEPQRVNGKRGKELRRIRRRIGMIFQGSNLVKRLSVLENVMTGRLGWISPARSLLYGFTDKEVERALEALAKVGVRHLAFRRAETLSGGEMQRVAIARAILQEPYLLLADEPVASLDPKNAEVVLDYLRPLTEQMAIIGVFHHLDIVRKYCTRAIGIKDGVVAYDGKPDVPPHLLSAVYGSRPPVWPVAAGQLA
ncbi:MAG TPA: phosphonate ABC transporter ATP-binding protein [Firmicutes bacterium]|nr:phosphonate ABC transporter ATP-binding protein [Bacillota bacterium]